MAYQSDESGRYEVYVQPFPGPGRKFQISTDGGERPNWNPKGGELFYGSPGNKMMVVDVTTSPAFSASRPRVLFEGLETSITDPTCCEVSPDGERFLMIKEGDSSDAELILVQNWGEELKRLVPTGN